MELLTTYAWILWLGLILVFFIVEMSTLEFTFLMIAIGSVGGLVSGLFGLPWWVQIVVAGALSLLLLLAVKPPLLRRLRRGGDSSQTLVDALLGMEGTVVKDFVDGQGQVKLTVGETWTSRLASPQRSEPQTGDRVTVTSIEGATAVVTPVKGTAK